jgi:4-amino-4-deoxy-L-arabinose transferase-like glycosyltransferase
MYRLFWSDKFFLLPAILLGTFLYFYNLDNYFLGLDLGDYPVHALHILEYGVPYILGDDPPIFDPSFTVDGVWAYHPWLGMYCSAISIWLFGQTTFAAVFPTGVAGVFSILGLYHLSRKVYPKAGMARLAIIFYLLSVPFTLYMRTSRYLGISIFLSILTVICFISLLKNSRGPITWFCVSSILLFYSMYSQFFGMFVGFFLYTVFFVRSRLLIKKLLKACLIIAIATFPWFLKYFMAIQGKIESSYTATLGEVYEHSLSASLRYLIAFLAEINSYFFPFLLILIWILVTSFKWISFELTEDKKVFFFIMFGVLFVSTLHPMPLINHTLAILPILLIFLAEACYQFFYLSKPFGSILVLTIILTNWLHIAPWFIFENFLIPMSKIVKVDLVNDESPRFWKLWVQNILISNQARYHLKDYVNEITSDYNGPLKAIVKYLKEHSTPGERFLSTHEVDSIRYYTGLVHYIKFPFPSPPEWIIPRGPRIDFFEVNYYRSKEQKAQTSAYVWNYLKTHPYEKIVLDVWDNGYENSYNMQNHLFENPPGAHKVTIYRFTKK